MIGLGISGESPRRAREWRRGREGSGDISSANAHSIGACARADADPVRPGGRYGGGTHRRWLWSGTTRHDPVPTFLAHWGYDLDMLRAGRWYTLVTMTLFPTAHSDWLPMLTQTVLLVALAGWCAGPWWGVAAFWLPNLVGTALVSLGVIWPMDVAGVAFAHRWAMEPDSGASVGIYGALGFLLALLPRPLRWVAIGGVAAWILVAVVRERHVWNIEHCGGYVLGVSLVRWRRRHDAPSSNSAASGKKMRARAGLGD